jgi:DNA-binding transcriptional LysR family regulator
VTLLELFRNAGSETPRVHAIQSVSAMAQLVEAGFGIATLPRAAVDHLSLRLPLRVLQTDVVLEPLPMHVSYREDPTSHLTEAALASAVEHATQRRAGTRRTAN